MTRPFLQLPAVAVAAFLTIHLSYQVGFATHYVVSIWPVTALNYWAVRRYGAPAIGAVFAADAANALFFLGVPPFVLLTSAGNSVAAWLAVLAERRVSSSEDIFASTRSALAFFLVGLGTISVVSALIGGIVLGIHFDLPGDAVFPLFWRWTLSDYTGGLILAPLLFTAGRLGLTRENKKESIADGLACLVSIGLVWIFGRSGLSELYGHYPTILVTMPLILWVALRSDTPRVCLVFTLVSISALILTLGAVSDLNDASWLAVQLYLTLVVACGYILHIVQLDRVRLLHELRRERNLLEERVAERTTELRREVELRSALAEKLKQAGKRAQAASRAKSEFLANMSHEIRTPLNGMIGALQLLEETRLGPEQRDLLRISGSCGKGLLTIINDILDLSKVEAGRLEVDNAPLNIKAHASEVLDGLRTAVRKEGVRLRLETSPDLPESISSDKLRIRQILYNLVGNALKFTDKGAVTVSISIDPIKDSEVEADLVLQVRDTGSGISRDQMATVFEPFTQGHPATSTLHQGTGLGLSIVQRLARLMGGSVKMESTEGVGTTVTVRLRVGLSPVAGNVVPKQKAPTKPNQEAAGPLHILLAEDNTVNQLILEKYLKKQGHLVATAENGSRALELLSEQDFDCILMDIQMPVLDGLEATRIIRANDSGRFNPRIPIVAMTAYAMTEDRERFLQAGVSDYIAKPVDLKRLSRILDRISSSSG
jgi:signal transduction histidine kinase/ActR/RegA family two-component response regulator